MPKRIKEEEKRVHFHCMLSPATLKAINETTATDGGSQGEVVDRAVAVLAFGEEIGRVSAAEPRKAARVTGLATPGLDLDPKFPLPVYKKRMTREQIAPVFGNNRLNEHMYGDGDGAAPVYESMGVSSVVSANSKGVRLPRVVRRGIRPKGDSKR